MWIPRVWLFAISLLAAAQTTLTVGAISGVVIDRTSGVPLGGVVITARSSRAGAVSSAISGPDGQFAISKLPYGSFIVSASKPAFLATTYGSSMPGEPGIPLTLSAERPSLHIEIAMARGAVVFGEIRDLQGQPERKAEVTLLRVARLGDDEVAEPLATVRSDDRGQYRFFGVAPGAVVVSVKPSSLSAGGVAVRSDEEIDQLLLWLTQGHRVPQTTGSQSGRPGRTTRQPVPLYFPGGNPIGPSGVLSVESGRENQLDMVLPEIEAGAISGTVVGVPMGASALVTLEPLHPLRFATSQRVGRSVSTSTDGDFAFNGVSPGAYRVQARVSQQLKSGEGTAARTLLASERVDIASDQRLAVVLGVTPVAAVTGRVVVAASKVGLPAPRAITIQLTSTEVRAPSSIYRAQMNQDGRFVFESVSPGAYQISVEIAANSLSEWVTESARCGLVDALDLPCNLPSTGDLVVSITDQPSGIAGRLDSGEGIVPSELQIVAFSTAEIEWRRGGRRLKVVRPNVDGQFEVELPEGAYYLGALTPVSINALTSEMLRRLALSSVKVQVPRREVVIQGLRVVR